jgi:hypothetical protein
LRIYKQIENIAVAASCTVACDESKRNLRKLMYKNFLSVLNFVQATKRLMAKVIFFVKM